MHHELKSVEYLIATFGLCFGTPPPDKMNGLNMNEVQAKNSFHARQGAKLQAGDGDQVWAYSGSTIWARRGSVVYAHKGSRVYAYDGAIVHAYEGSEVWACGSAVVNVAEYGAFVEAGKGTTLNLGCGVTALVNAGANVHVQNAEQVLLEKGWSGRVLSVVCREGATVFGGTGNSLYIERGAIYL